MLQQQMVRGHHYIVEYVLCSFRIMTHKSKRQLISLIYRLNISSWFTPPEFSKILSLTLSLPAPLSSLIPWYDITFEELTWNRSFIIITIHTVIHSSEIRVFCLMKCSSKMLQNLPYFWNTKTHMVFYFIFFFILCYFTFFPPNECPGLSQHRLGHSSGEKVK